MSKVLMESLKLDLPALAEMIRAKGRGRDTMLAHITPKEAALLKRRGGRGSINPDTGLPEFEDDFSYDIGFGPDQYSAPVTPQDIKGTTFSPEESAMYGYSDTPFSYPESAPTAPTAPTAAYDPMQASQEGFAYTGPEGQQISPTQTAFTPTGAGMSGADILAYQQGNYPVSPRAVTPGAKERESLFGDTGKYLAGALGAGVLNAGRAATGTAVAGGLTAANLARTRQAQQQAQESKQELQSLGTPYQAQGKELARAAQAGELNAANQQIVNAARAQANQAVATRGGVGQQQAQNAISDLTARLLQNQYDLGLKVMNIGDNYVSGAIRTGLQADQMINQANQQFYSSLAQMAAPFLLGQQPVYQVTTPRG